MMVCSCSSVVEQPCIGRVGGSIPPRKFLRTLISPEWAILGTRLAVGRLTLTQQTVVRSHGPQPSLFPDRLAEGRVVLAHETRVRILVGDPVQQRKSERR